MLAGAPTLRTPDGEQVLGPWDLAWFPRGADGAHGCATTPEPARGRLPLDRLRSGGGGLSGRGQGRCRRRLQRPTTSRRSAAGWSCRSESREPADHAAEETPPGVRFASLGRERTGGELLGASLYEFAPGDAALAVPLARGNEEWAIVVAGTPTLRAPEGERELRPATSSPSRGRGRRAHALQPVRGARSSSSRRSTRVRRIPTAARSAFPATSSASPTPSTTGTAKSATRAERRHHRLHGIARRHTCAAPPSQPSHAVHCVDVAATGAR